MEPGCNGRRIARWMATDRGWCREWAGSEPLPDGRTVRHSSGLLHFMIRRVTLNGGGPTLGTQSDLLGGHRSVGRAVGVCCIHLPLGHSAGGRGIFPRGIPAAIACNSRDCQASGAIVLIMPGVPKLKEWAYAGFTFAWISAFVAHYLAKDGPAAFLPLLLLVFLIISYVTRPASRQWPAEVATV